MDKCFLLIPEKKKFGADPSYRFREKRTWIEGQYQAFGNHDFRKPETDV